MCTKKVLRTFTPVAVRLNEEWTYSVPRAIQIIMHCPTGTPSAKAKLFQTIEDSGRLTMPDGCLGVSDYFKLPALSSHHLSETFHEKGYRRRDLQDTRTKTDSTRRKSSE